MLPLSLSFTTWYILTIVYDPGGLSSVKMSLLGAEENNVGSNELNKLFWLNKKKIGFFQIAINKFQYHSFR